MLQAQSVDQKREKDDDAGASQARASRQQGDIIVTATRRDEALMDVPLSIAAFDQGTLDTRGVKDIQGIGNITPGFTVTPGYGGRTDISIRGISSGFGASTTGVYIDDTPVQTRSVSIAYDPYPTLFDLERVEILRGPQGTLFGASAEGGAVRFITPEPGLTTYTGYARAEVSVTEHGDPSYEAGAALGGPIVADRIGFRASLFRRREGGYVDRVPYAGDYPTKKNADSIGTTAGRIALALAPTDNLRITPAVFHQTGKRDDTSLYLVSRSNPARGDFVQGNPEASVTRDRFTLYSVKTEYDVGRVNLIGNTSLFDRRNVQDNDFTLDLPAALGLFDPAAPDDTPVVAALAVGALSRSNVTSFQKVFTQELRLQSDDDADTRFTWVVGGFYQNARQRGIEDDTAPNLGALFGVPVEALFGLPLLDGRAVYRSDDRSRDRQIAAFGQIDYRLTDRLTATVGARIARVKLDFAQAGDGPLNGGPTGQSGRTAETPFTPKLGIEYKPTDDLLFYASAAKGYRTGGINSPVPVSQCKADLDALGFSQVPGSYKSDSVWSYEVGAKGKLGRAFSFETSVFNIDWNDIQNARALSCGLLFVDNLGKARSRGFDAVVTLRPAAGLSLQANVGYSDATIRKTIRSLPTASQPGIVASTGDKLGISPWSVSLQGDYQTAIGGRAQAYLHAEYNHRSGYNGSNPANLNYDPILSVVDSNNLVAARLGLRIGGLDYSFFVNNLLDSTDALARQRYGRVTPFVSAITFRPRTFGALLTYRF